MTNRETALPGQGLAPDDLIDLANALHDALATRTPISAPASLWPGLSIADAYRLQRLNIERRLKRGERVVGRKVGLTSLAMQRQLGVDQPDFGVITDRMVIADGGALDIEELISPRLEAEFAFRFGRDLPVSPALDELTAALDGVALAIEIIDSRVADWDISLVDTVADNASSARIVHGSFAPLSDDTLRALPTTVIALLRDDDEVTSGPGSAVLGDPLVSLHWLATAIGDYGESFRAGDVVLAGAVAAAVPLIPGSTWQARADGYAPVTLHSRSEGDGGGS